MDRLTVEVTAAQRYVVSLLFRSGAVTVERPEAKAIALNAIAELKLEGMLTLPPGAPIPNEPVMRLELSADVAEMVHQVITRGRMTPETLFHLQPLAKALAAAAPAEDAGG